MVKIVSIYYPHKYFLADDAYLDGDTHEIVVTVNGVEDIRLRATEYYIPE